MRLLNLVSRSLHTPVERYLHTVLEFMGTCKDFRFALIPNVITLRPNWKHTSGEDLPSLGCPRPTVHSDCTHAHTYFLSPLVLWKNSKDLWRKNLLILHLQQLLAGCATTTASSVTIHNHLRKQAWASACFQKTDLKLLLTVHRAQEMDLCDPEFNTAVI